MYNQKHCVKSVHIWNFSRIWTEYGEILWTRKTTNIDTFHAVKVAGSKLFEQLHYLKKSLVTHDIFKEKVNVAIPRNNLLNSLIISSNSNNIHSSKRLIIFIFLVKIN